MSERLTVAMLIAVASAFPILVIWLSGVSFVYVAMVIGLSVVGLASIYAGFILLAGFLDKQCEKCLREQPDNPFCCE